MSDPTATGQHTRPDMIVVTLIHQSLRIDAMHMAELTSQHDARDAVPWSWRRRHG